ncbi:MAG TPA: hypothetical protein VLA16_16765 [Ideonella sp.]|nr:hypothetical protein [Ideonella sp.]
MAHSSILGGETAAEHASGKDTDALGPSDSSDSGSDVQGERAMPTRPDRADELGAVTVDGGSDSDALGTGERGSAEGNDGPAGADILPNRIIDGLDELGASDESDGIDPQVLADGPGGNERNRDVERLEDDEDDEDAEGDPPEDPSDEDGPDPGNTAVGRETDRLRQTLNGPLAA